MVYASLFPRHCERSEAIHCRLVNGKMDCFRLRQGDVGQVAALAMTKEKNGGPFDPPPVMQYCLVKKVYVPLARQRPKGPGYQPRGQACAAGLA